MTVLISNPICFNKNTVKKGDTKQIIKLTIPKNEHKITKNLFLKDDSVFL